MANNQTKRTSAGGVHALQYPFVWCPKYRRGVLTGDGASALERLLHEKASALGVEIISLAIRPDHVHCVITGLPTMSVHQLVRHKTGR